ncbi:MAG: sugar transporter permease, partial [Pseudonocardiales bacterium]|nr:sugar transporter permease [Pseudonocardiales bacterium]
MSTATATEVGHSVTPDVPARRRRQFSWGTVGTVGTVVVMLVWCLAPFYWMLVMSFRDK